MTAAEWVRFQQLRDANGELVESLERATEARDAFKDERNSALAEVRSLRGVVQAALSEHGHVGPTTKYCRSLILHEGTCNCWRAALAAAADAPQPAPPDWKCGACGRSTPFPAARPLAGGVAVFCPHCGVEGDYVPGPSPAVLPQPEDDPDEAESKRQWADYQSGRWCGECRFEHVEDPPCCYGPSPAVLPQTETAAQR